MSRSIYWKITLPIILVVVVSLNILGFFMVNTVRTIQLDHLRFYLTNEARLVADTALPDMLDSAGYSRINALAKTTGLEIGAR